ncbi:hypothetical protein Tco_1049853 [Tanacetum coccineum]
MLIEFVIQNQFFSYTIEESGQILGIPSNGDCSFTDKWSRYDLQYSVPTSGPYKTNPPSPNEIKNYVQEDREGLVTRIRHDKVIDDHVSACLFNMLYCIASERLKRTCSSSSFVQPFLSHPNYDDNDGNDEGPFARKESRREEGELRRGEEEERE